MNEKVDIDFTPVWCTVVSNNSFELHNYLNEKLAYRPDGYFFSPKYQEGEWDGWSRLYKINTKRFRVGLLSRVIQLLSKKGCEVFVINFPSRENTALKKSIYMTGDGKEVELREYQKEAILAALSKRFGIIQAPMRSGKTLISTAIIDNEDSYPVIFYLRNKDLAYQTLEVFKNNFKDISIGFVCDGVCETGKVNIITIQSAYSAYGKMCKDKSIPKEKEVIKKSEVKDLIKRAKVIFMDEVQDLEGATSGFIFDKCINASMKIGLSATPFSNRASSILVEERVGSIIYKIGYSDLIKAGYLMRPYIYMYKLPKVDVEGTYRAIYKQAVIENKFLNDLLINIVRKLTDNYKSVVIQTEFVNHSKEIARMLNCEYLTGSDSTEKRLRLKQELIDKKILCLVSTLFERGLDVPTLDYTINLAGGLSNISTFQRMRSITAHESKTTIGIIDFIHQCKYLKKHSEKRLDLYSSEPEFVIEIRDVSKKSIEEIFS